MTALHPDARDTLIYEITQALRPLSGADWEPLGHRLAELLAGTPLLHRGQGIKGNPQGYTVDSYSNDGSIAAEYGTEDGYFNLPKAKGTAKNQVSSGGDANAIRIPTKPESDYKHVREELPGAKRIFLLSTQPATANEMTEVTNWCGSVNASDGVDLHVYDARRLADYIVDELFEDETIAEELAKHLEPLRRALDLHAATNTLPMPQAHLIERPAIEDAVIHALDHYQIALIAGMSGMGKSVSAAAVANQLRDRFAWPVWTTELTVNSVADLAGAEVGRGGMRLNLRTMLATRSCLVVLDDMRSKERLTELLEQLRSSLGPEARLIVTSQHVVDTPFTVEMKPMDELAAKRVLEYKAPPCPAAAFHVIWKAVGGHALTLGVLNGLARDRYPWADLARDAERIGELPLLERPGKVVDIVIGTRRGELENSLGVFLWAQSPRVHVGFLRHATPGGERALRRFGLVTDDQPDTIRLHDIVWSSLTAFDPPLRYSADHLEEALDGYVAGLARNESRTMIVNHLARVHEPLLSRLVNSGRWRLGHLYAWLHAPQETRMVVEALPDPKEVAKDAAQHGDAFRVQVASELAERAVLLTKERSTENDQDTALLSPFDLLLESAVVASEEKVYVRHHKAKALKRLGRHLDAVKELEAIVEECGAEVPPAVVRLLLARILTELPWGITLEASETRARELLLGLLDEAVADGSRVSPSVTLAAAELLRRSRVRIDVAAILPRYADLLESLIVDAARRGLVQGPLAFGALATSWKSVDGEAFWRVFEALPLPSVPGVDEFEPDERNAMTAWGEILVAAAEHDPGRSVEFFEAALGFFTASPKAYGRIHAADVLTRLGRPAEAIDIIRTLLTDKLSQNDRAWAYRRMAEAQKAQGDLSDARVAAQEAYECLPEGNAYRDTFKRFLDEFTTDYEVA
jgi:tetratricopeptide (TPR) repeat protein